MFNIYILIYKFEYHYNDSEIMKFITLFSSLTSISASVFENKVNSLYVKGDRSVMWSNYDYNTVIEIKKWDIQHKIFFIEPQLVPKIYAYKQINYSL